MVLVSIDVAACRDAANRLEKLAGEIEHQAMLVLAAAGAAGESTPSLNARMFWISSARTGSADMHARVDLAILVNGGDEGALLSGPINYKVPADDGRVVRGELGRQLAALSDPISGSPEDLERIEALNAHLAAWLEDDVVMSAMYDALGPAGSLDLLAAVGAAGYDAQERSLPLAESLRKGLETASNAWPDEKAQQWGRDLAQHGAHPPMDGDGAYQGGDQALALSFLAASSGLDTRTLFGIAERIDELERRSGQHFEQYNWAGRSTLALSALWHAFPKDRQDAAYDPMTSLFQSMADHPSTALEFFDDPARQEYWIKDRDWSHDSFRSVAEVLDSATTDRSLIDPPTDADGNLRPEAVAAAELASATVHYLPQNGGFGGKEEGGFLMIDGTIVWGGAEAGADLAHIVSTYMPAVNAALDQSFNQTPPASRAGIDALGRPVPLLPVFNRGDLATVIETASRNDAGFAELRSGVSAQNNAVLAAVAQDPADDRVSRALTSGAELEGFFAYNVGGGDVELAQSRDARNQSWVDLGSDLAGAIPVPGGDAVGFLVDQGVDLTSEQVGDSLTGNESRAVGDANDMAEQAQNAYYRSSTWALDEAGALPYQQPGAERPDLPGTRGGEVLTEADIAALPRDQQAAARDEVVTFATSEHGLGGFVDPQDLESAFKNPFLEFFEDASD